MQHAACRNATCTVGTEWQELLHVPPVCWDGSEGADEWLAIARLGMLIEQYEVRTDVECCQMSAKMHQLWCERVAKCRPDKHAGEGPQWFETFNLQHAICSVQHTTCNMRHATCDM